MKKSLLLLLAALAGLHGARATHIVGGELELTSRNSQTYTYTLALNLYFDVINGDPGAEDETSDVSIFSKRSNQLVAVVTLPKNRRDLVSYTDPACVTAQLRTRRIRYEREITLRPDFFNDSQGYYAVWERCCRNQIIANIQVPGDVGNSLYLEFPAVTAAGKAFVNSSPVFAMPAGDYACANRPFTFAFGATDADGDELRYSLVTPFAGYSSKIRIKPSASPAPYPEVQWITGLSLDNVIPGPQPLRVDPNTGLLRFTANRTGLFVFSVLCEEYRDRVKIGEVRRDFQLLVVDCPRNDPPQVRLKEKLKPDFYRRGEIITLRADQTDRCMDLLLTDAGNQENVQVRIRPVNFPADVVSINPAAGVIRNGTDTLRAQLCWTECAVSEPGKPYEFDVIVQDDGCPLPATDTLRVKLIIEPLPNQPPAVRTTLPGNAATVPEGSLLTFDVTGTDPDADLIALEAVGRGFNLADVGMAFTNSTGKAAITTPFVWTPPCDKVREGQPYTVDFIVTDRRCPRTGRRDTVTVQLRYQSKPNRRPEVTTTLPGGAATLLPGQAVRFDVIGTDPDNDVITVRAAGRGFSLSEAGMRFKNNATGVGRLREPFVWEPGCPALGLVPGGLFVVDFVLQDNTCAPNRTDTVSVRIQVKDREYTIPADSVPNAFTPNGDAYNEDFRILEFMPPDNCSDQFVKVEICNRWGNLVFESTSRELNWTGLGHPTGVYYYVVRFRRKTYRGTVSLLR